MPRPPVLDDYLYRCPRCPFGHRSRLDELACAAVYGEVKPWPLEVRDPFCRCRLCNYMAHGSLMLHHFYDHHRYERIVTGYLVDLITDTRDVATVEPEPEKSEGD